MPGQTTGPIDYRGAQRVLDSLFGRVEKSAVSSKDAMAANQADEGVLGLLPQVDSSDMIFVYRIRPEKRKMKIHGKLTVVRWKRNAPIGSWPGDVVARLTEEIQEVAGGGDYLAKVQEKGKRVYTKATLHVNGPPKVNEIEHPHLFTPEDYGFDGEGDDDNEEDDEDLTWLAMICSST